jgi:Uma2 family endonuclease
MALRANLPTYSRAEYLAIERAASYRSEYLDGQIVAMSGRSRAHSLIAANLIRVLGTALRDRPCEVHGSDLRCYVEAGDLYTYPDVTVICDPPRFEDEAADTVMNPVVIIEVLSPATEAFDRGEKFARYRLLPSLREYVLVAQHRPRVERFTLRDGEWVLSEASGLEAAIELSTVGCTLLLDEVYAKLSFDAPASAPGDVAY